MSFGWLDRRKTRGPILAALLAYGLVLTVTPILHHDLECHWRTPGHCVACTATPAALGAGDLGPGASPSLADLGGVEQRCMGSPDAAHPPASNGRAPPLQGS